MASGIYNDWSWKPGAKTIAALKRGEARLVERRRSAKEDLVHWDLPAKRRPATKKAMKADQQSRLEIFLYDYRTNPAEGLMKGKKMSWACLLYFMMDRTRVLGRYPDRAKAEKAIRQFRDKVEYDSFYIVDGPDDDIRHFDNNVLNGLFHQFGDPRFGIKKLEQRQAIAMYYMSVFDKSRHGADGSLLKPYKQAPLQGLIKMKVEIPSSEVVGETSATTETATPEKAKNGKKKAAKKTVAKKKVAKKSAPAKATKKTAKTKTATPVAKGDRTPRAEGKAAIIKQALNEGKMPAKVLDLVQEKCTDTDKVTESYVKWYLYDMARKGNLTPAGKKVLDAVKQRGKE